MMKRNKTFLSDSHEEFDSIRWNVGTNPNDCLRREVTAEVMITDCSKVICLDFDCQEQRHIDKRIAKVDILINELTKFRDALESCKKSKKYYY